MMEQLTIRLGEKPNFGGKWFRVTQVALGVLFMAMGLATMGKMFWFSPLIFGYGVILVVAFLLGPRFSRTCAITLDDRGIKGRISYSQEIDFLWEDLALAEIKMYALILKTVKGGTIYIELGDFTYVQHKDAKPRLIDILGTKGLLKKPA
jgi:hypothetical protein